MKPAIFIDRDGTINKDCPYCKSAEEISIYRDVLKPIRELSKRYYIIMVTNQSGVSRGYFGRKDLDSMHEKIKGEIRKAGGRIDAIYYCPHLPDAGCDCRKPKTGMIDSAVSDFKIDMANSFIVGDSDADVELGRRVGITSIRVRREGHEKADFYAKDFGRVLKIVNESRRKGVSDKWKTPKVGLILAGGEGTRMRPLTYRIPKPMAIVKGKPIIEHVINELTRNGIHRIFISVGYKSGIIMKYLGDGSRLKTKIEYVIEKKPLGTGGGTKLALNTIKNRYGRTDVFMTNGDDLFNLSVEPMYKQHKETGAVGTLSVREEKDVTGSGVVLLEGEKITGFVEKPDNTDTPSHLINLGKYVFSTDITKFFPKKAKFMLEREFFQNSARKANLYGYIVKGRWYPINTVKALKEAGKRWG